MSTWPTASQAHQLSKDGKLTPSQEEVISQLRLTTTQAIQSACAKGMYTVRACFSFDEQLLNVLGQELMADGYDAQVTGFRNPCDGRSALTVTWDTIA